MAWVGTLQLRLSRATSHYIHHMWMQSRQRFSTFYPLRGYQLTLSSIFPHISLAHLLVEARDEVFREAGERVHTRHLLAWEGSPTGNCSTLGGELLYPKLITVLAPFLSQATAEMWTDFTGLAIEARLASSDNFLRSNKVPDKPKPSCPSPLPDKTRATPEPPSCREWK